MRDGMLIF